MKKPIQAVLIAVVVLLVGSTVVLYQRYRKANTDYADMKQAEEQVRAQYVEAFNAIAEIQDSLNAIGTKEGATKLQPSTLAAEERLTEPDRREVMDSIARLSDSIQRAKGKISDLEKSLRQSGLKVAGLQKMVAKLKESVAEREQQVAQLTGQVDQLNTQVAGLQTTVEQDQQAIQAKDQDIEQKRKELGTIYYVIGSKKELAQRGVIVAKGGVLGLGKTLQLSGQYNDQLFTALDTDQQTDVHAPATKVQVLSPQATSSYEIKLEGNQVTLHILDPAEFRKVKHLVIMTA